MKRFCVIFLLLGLGLLMAGCDAPESKEKKVAKENLDRLAKAQWFYYENYGKKHFATSAKQLIDTKCLPESFSSLDSMEGVVLGEYCFHMIKIPGDTNFRFAADPTNNKLPPEKLSIDITGFILER